MGGIIGSLFKITEHTLSIYQTKQARKYLDRVVYLKREYYEESNKPENKQNHARMDNITAELRIISESVALFGKPKTSN